MPKTIPRHPGRILYEDILHPAGLSCREVAKSLRLPTTRISELVRTRRGVTAETALLLAERFPQTTAEMWMDWQRDYDLAVARAAR